MSRQPPTAEELQRQVDAWAHPEGTAVRFWPGAREGEPCAGVTRSAACILGGHTAGVYIAPGGFVALSHVEVVDDPSAVPTGPVAGATAIQSGRLYRFDGNRWAEVTEPGRVECESISERDFWLREQDRAFAWLGEAGRPTPSEHADACVLAARAVARERAEIAALPAPPSAVWGDGAGASRRLALVKLGRADLLAAHDLLTGDSLSSVSRGALLTESQREALGPATKQFASYTTAGSSLTEFEEANGPLPCELRDRWAALELSTWAFAAALARHGVVR